MKKLRMETPDLTQTNIEKIAELFPNVVTEMMGEDGGLKRGINFDLLKQELSGDVIDGEESYDFTWVGKRASIVEANAKIRKTLRPSIVESKNWETTENLYIEGDNLDVLKLLQESYLNSIKMIYIDPPYNTGNDSFVYPDNFTMDQDEYDEGIEYRDEEGNINFRKNNETNPRFHSDWCSMMYPRLKLARNLLSDDGVIFISIDDNEVHTLKQMCNEVFGEQNFVANVIWERAFSPVNLKKHFSESHDHLLCYAKQLDRLMCNGLARDQSTDGRYANLDNDPRGPWTSSDLSVGPVVADKVYEIVAPSGRGIYPSDGRCWVYTQERFQEMLSDNRIWFGRDGDSVPRLKRFLADVKEGITPMTIWKYDAVGHSQEAKQELKKLFGGKALFDYPKSVGLIERMMQLYTSANSTVLDFFSGSATTAHAVMQLNAEDGGNRKFIMVQLLEETDENSEAFKAGYKTIADIGKERIRRAGEKIKAEVEEANAKLGPDEEPKKIPDIGFRVLKVDSTNMNDVYYAANEISQDLLQLMESNTKGDRSDLDLLYGVMVDWGLQLSLSHKIEEIAGITVHTVDEGSLVACFADAIPEQVVREIAKRQPLRVVFKDSSFGSSAEKINVSEIFKLLAPNTTVRVI